MAERLTEKRIYVVVAEKVIVGDDDRAVVQPGGRIAAQAVHAARMMQGHMTRASIAAEIAKSWQHASAAPIHKKGQTAEARLRELVAYMDGVIYEIGLPHRIEPTITIVLGARDNLEVFHVWGLLDKAKIPSYMFRDINEEAYGTPDSVLTALATEPVEPDRVAGILDYLPLWTPEGTSARTVAKGLPAKGFRRGGEVVAIPRKGLHHVSK